MRNGVDLRACRRPGLILHHRGNRPVVDGGIKLRRLRDGYRGRHAGSDVSLRIAWPGVRHAAVTLPGR